MSGSIVSWADYQGLANTGGLYSDVSDGGYSGGFATGADVDALNKALVAGNAINNPGTAPGEGFPLRVESLDQTLFTTTYRATDIKFWRSLYKDAAYNTVEEFNRLEEYGSGDSIFIGEGELPTEDDSTYSRQYTQIKFMGTTRRVTHVLSTVRTAHGDAVARETVNGTLFLLRQMERTLFNGDENLIDIQFDGIETLLVKAFNISTAEDQQYLGYEDENVIDLRGEPMSEDVITDLTERLVAEPNYGMPSDLWSSTGPVKDLSKILYPKERYDLPAPRDGRAGIAINSIVTPFGDISLNPDIFFPDSKTPGNAIGKASLRPGAPTINTLSSPTYAGSNTTYWGADDAGAYWYKVVAGSRFGRSVAANAAATIDVSAGDQVNIPVVDNGPDTSYYEVYRSDKDGALTTARSVFRVKRTAPAQTIVDLNRFLPNTSKAYLLSQQADVFKWKQLAPFLKIPLATIDTSIRWMMIIYGALQLMKPRYNGIFINVGKLPTGAYA